MRAVSLFLVSAFVLCSLAARADEFGDFFSSCEKSCQGNYSATQSVKAFWVGGEDDTFDGALAGHISEDDSVKECQSRVQLDLVLGGWSKPHNYYATNRFTHERNVAVHKSACCICMSTSDH